MVQKILKTGFALLITLHMVFGLAPAILQLVSVTGAALNAFTIQDAHAAGDGCAKERKKMTPPSDCSTGDDKRKAACNKCKDAIEKHEGRMAKFDQNREICKTRNQLCAASILAAAGGGDAATRQRAEHLSGGRVNDHARECRDNQARENLESAQLARNCKNDVKAACQDFEDKKNEHKTCQAAEKDATNAAKDNKEKANAAGDNKNKADDNAKKGESAGGGMPQMPQIPQQQGGEEQQPQQQADYPQATSPTPGSESKPPEIETAKFDEDKDKTAIPAVGFGNTTPTGTATVTAPGNSFAAQGIDPNLRGLAGNNFGDKPEGGAVAATASPPGGSGSGGLNSSGASLPGGGQQGGDTAKGPNEANPYEIPVGSGGRLGAPKGKTGGESDTALDAAASTAFKDDFKGGDLAGSGTGADVAAGGEEDPGYTIFKMVKYRYAELKKKGNI